MQITFLHNKKSLVVPANAPAEIKLYTVPKNYSEDGYCASVWMPQELEPVPACAASSTELLAHISITMQQDGQAAPVALFCKEGVTYAAN